MNNDVKRQDQKKRNFLLDGILLKIQGRGLALSKGPVGKLDNIAVRTNSGDESVAVNGVDSVEDLES